EQTRQDVGADGGRRSEDQRAGLQVAQRIDSVAACVQGLQHALGMRQEAGSNLGQAHAATGALEQTLAEGSLEGLDARGDGWLSQEKSFGRAAKTALVSYLYERFKLAKVH